MRQFIASSILALVAASTPVAYNAVTPHRSPVRTPVSTTVPGFSVGADARVGIVPPPSADRSHGDVGRISTPNVGQQVQVVPSKPADFECPYPGRASIQQGPASYPGTLEAQYHWRDSTGRERWCDLPTGGLPSVGDNIDQAWQQLGFCTRLADYFLRQTKKTDKWNGCSAASTGTLHASSPASNVLAFEYTVPGVSFNFDAKVAGQGAAVAATTDVTVAMTFRFADGVDGSNDDASPATIELATVRFSRTNFDFQDGLTNFWIGGELDGPQGEMNRSVVDVTDELGGQATVMNRYLHIGARWLGSIVPAGTFQAKDVFGLSVSIDGPGLLVRYERDL